MIESTQDTVNKEIVVTEAMIEAVEGVLFDIDGSQGIKVCHTKAARQIFCSMVGQGLALKLQPNHE